MAFDAVGQLRGGMRYGVCALAALVLLSLGPNLNVFVAVPRVSGQRSPLAAPQPSAAVQGEGVSKKVLRAGSSSAEAHAPSSLCGLFTAAVAVVVCLRGAQVVMRNGKANFGQSFMPSLKGGKKLHWARPRRPYGTKKTLRQPRRYELYDILEDLDETHPAYTIISEPDEPMMPVEGAPLLERYPWAGELKRIHNQTMRRENHEEHRLAPAFQPLWKAPPPQGWRQSYIERRGFPKAKQPPWLNRPEIGYEVKVPFDKPFKKFRQPERSEMGPKLRAQFDKEQEAKRLAEPAKELDADDLDDELDALES